MRKFFTLAIFFVFISFLISAGINAQTCVPTGINGSVVNLSCGQTCTNLSFPVPHLKSTETYAVNSIPYQPYQWVTATGTEVTSVYVDDKFSDSITLGFPFCFFGSTYSKCVLGSNGIITFDVVSNANKSNAYVLQVGTVAQPIPYAGGSPGSISPAYYPKASIMGAYTDIDPSDAITTPPADRKIEYRIQGTAPCRTFVASFYHIPYFECEDSIVTEQIAFHENTGLIEVFFESKPFACDASTNDGLAILGLQNWNRNLAVAAPGRNCTQFRAFNEGWRFTPNGATSQFVSSELLTLSLTHVADADTATTTPGLLNLNFPNFCPVGPTGTKYIIKTIFQSCTGGTQLISKDTISIDRINALTATSTSTPSTCGTSVGTINATLTGGTGTPPFMYTLTPGPVTNTTGIFTGLAGGNYSISITDANNCPVTITQTVGNISSLPSTISATGTTCPGINNGTVTAVPTAGTAPYTFSINGGTTQPTGIFTNLASGTYTVTFTDANGCTGTSTIVTVTAGTAITSTLSGNTGTSCNGINDGSVTVTPTSGTGPYTYSVDGGAAQASNIITGLSSGNHTITITDASGCTGTKNVFIAAGSGLAGTYTATSTSCPGVSNAVVTVTPSNGIAPYTYSLDGGPFLAGPVTGVSAAIHTITIKDANGCTGDITIIITAGSGITATAVPTPSACAGVNNGVITITCSGTAPFSYSTDGGVTYTPMAGNTITNLAPGTYNLMIKDANGCRASVSTTVLAGTTILFTTSSTLASCPGVNNATITVTPTSGTAPYTYSIDGGVTFQPLAGNTIPGVGAGIIPVIIKDANGCTGATNVTVNAGAGITGTFVAVATSCPGVSTGSVTMTATSGDAPYTYAIDGGTFQASNTFSGLSSGAHVVTIKDGNGCTGDVNVNVGPGVGITGSATAVATSCPGVDNGSVTVAPLTGTSPYTYSIDGGAFQAGNIFTGLASGPHVASFRDANGCIGIANVNVPVGAGITATTSSVATSCPGVNNGSVTVTSATGTAPYIYTIDGGPSQPGDTFTGLASGPHVITFQDANGCVGTKNVTVTAGAVITATSTTVATSCPGVANGSATITPTTGSAPYTYSIDGGASQAGNTFNGLASGPHIVSFQDANGCVGTKNVTVQAGAGITGTGAAVATSCPGISNGSVTITPFTGTGPYTYSIDGGAAQPGNTFNGLASGPHVATFQDANGCLGTVNINVGPGVGITGSASAVATGCPGVNNGSITVTPATGTAPYSYSLDGGPSQTGGTFNNLAPGLHTATFTDANGCSGTASATVNTGSGLLSTEVVAGTSCPGVDNGTITLTPITGTAPYSYNIDGGATQGSNYFPDLTAGSHTIIFTDALGCTGTKTRIVTGGANLTSTITPLNPPCANINDGTITLTPTTGTTPYLYSLDGGLTTQPAPTFTNLAPGAYTVTFTDAIGCKGTKAITLTTHTAVTATIVLTKPLCNGNSNGIIKLTGAGGVSPYKYSKDGGVNYQTSGSFSGFAAGTYTFRISDNVGCIKDTTVTLTEPTILTASAISPSPATCNGNDGKIKITPAGGTPAYQYSIDGGITYQGSNIFTVPGGNYPGIIVKDNKGCVANAATSVVKVDNMVLDLGPDSSICIGSSIQFQPQTNAETNIFLWSSTDVLIAIPSGTIDNDTLKNATVTPSDTFSYTLSAQWGICTRKDTIIIFVKHKPVVDAGENQAICVNDSTAELQGSASNLSGNVNYAWTPAEGLQTPDASATLAILHSTTPYTLTVTDNYGCNFNVTDEVIISLQPPVPAFAGNDTIAVVGQPHQLMGSGGVSYEWTPAGPLNLTNVQYPLATLTHDQQFVVMVTDIAGCIGSDTVFVKVYAGPACYVPTAFSPNGDGLNDIFRVVPAGIAYTEWFRIFNRYGELVFETNKFLQGWDGSYLGRKQPIGNYVWMLKGMDKNGKAVEMKGTVLLVR